LHGLVLAFDGVVLVLPVWAAAVLPVSVRYLYCRATACL
jgi:hypothetical protein